MAYRIGIDGRMFASGFTGIGRYVAELVRALAALPGDETFVLFVNTPVDEDLLPKSPRFEVRVVNIPHYSLAEQVFFPRIIAQEKLDLMHFTHFNAPLFSRVPCVVTIHDLILSFYPGRKKRSIHHRLAYEWTLRSVTNRAQKIISVSAATASDLTTVLGVSDERIAVIHHGVDRTCFVRDADTNHIRQVGERYKIGDRYLAYAGVQREHKNLERLIRGFARFIELNSDDTCQLVLIGREDTNMPLRRIVDELGLVRRVVFPGFVSDAELVTLLSGALGYVFPSVYEGFGLPVLEAMALGLPVACSRIPSLQEIAGEGNACFFDPFDIASIATAIGNIAQDETYRQTLITRGYARVEDFSWERMATETLAVYRDALAPKKTPEGELQSFL